MGEAERDAKTERYIESRVVDTPVSAETTAKSASHDVPSIGLPRIGTMSRSSPVNGPCRRSHSRSSSCDGRDDPLVDQVPRSPPSLRRVWPFSVEMPTEALSVNEDLERASTTRSTRTDMCSMLWLAIT